MDYVVEIVDDGELPAGRDLVIVDRGPDLAPVLLLCGRQAEVWAAMRAWQCSRGPRETTSRLLHAI